MNIEWERIWKETLMLPRGSEENSKNLSKQSALALIQKPTSPEFEAWLLSLRKPTQCHSVYFTALRRAVSAFLVLLCFTDNVRIRSI
jgi:hypothetical protein